MRTRGKAWLSDDEVVRGIGRLVARATSPSSLRFYFRYCIASKQRYIPIGPYSLRERDGFFTLSQARERARELSALYRNPRTRDVRESAIQSLVPQASSATTATSIVDPDATVAALCTQYVDEKRRMGMSSAKDVRSTLDRCLKGTALAAMPASAVTPRDIVTFLAPIVQRAPRTAGKLRSILSAAYGFALRGPLDASTAVDWSRFSLESNPVRMTADVGRPGVRNRSLNARELGLLWMHLTHARKATTVAYRFLRLTLLLGGQRCAQLARTTLLDIDVDLRVIRLLDPKGKRSRGPRIHELPLCDLAWREVSELMAFAKSSGARSLFPARSASGHVNEGAISAEVKHIVEYFFEVDLLDPTRRAIVPKRTRRTEDECFCYADFRRTTESRMSELGVSDGLRAQILSHGLSGVQHVHYDRANYLPQKRSALAMWEVFVLECARAQSDSYLAATRMHNDRAIAATPQSASDTTRQRRNDLPSQSATNRAERP